MRVQQIGAECAKAVEAGFKSGLLSIRPMTPRELSFVREKLRARNPSEKIAELMQTDPEKAKALKEEVAAKQRQYHAKRKRGGCTSELRGVVWCRRVKQWRAQIRVGGKIKHLGYFESEQEAAAQYDLAAKIHHGDAAVTNLLGGQQR